MTSNLLPATTGEITELQKTVPVEINEVTVTEEQAVEALAKVGLVSLPAGILKSIETVGAYARGAGIIKTQRGRNMINQQRVDCLMMRLSEIIQSGEKSDSSGRKKKLTLADVITISKTMGILAGRMTEAQKVMVEIERLSTPTGTTLDEPVPPAHGFEAGQQVVPKPGTTQVFAREAHFHTGEPSKQQ